MQEYIYLFNIVKDGYLKQFLIKKICQNEDPIKKQYMELLQKYDLDIDSDIQKIRAEYNLSKIGTYANELQDLILYLMNLWLGYNLQNIKSNNKSEIIYDLFFIENKVTSDSMLEIIFSNFKDSLQNPLSLETAIKIRNNLRKNTWISNCICKLDGWNKSYLLNPLNSYYNAINEFYSKYNFTIDDL